MNLTFSLCTLATLKNSCLIFIWRVHRKVILSKIFIKRSYSIRVRSLILGNNWGLKLKIRRSSISLPSFSWRFWSILHLTYLLLNFRSEWYFLVLHVLPIGLKQFLEVKIKLLMDVLVVMDLNLVQHEILYRILGRWLFLDRSRAHFCSNLTNI